jgi:hypothetical protein
LFHVATATTAFALLIAALRRCTSLPLAVVVAYFAGFPLVAVRETEEVLLLLGFVLTVRILSQAADANARIGLWLGFGALAGFAALDKLSLGAGITALAAIALAFAAIPNRLRAIALGGGASVAVFAMGWFGTGNGIGNLVAYVRYAREAATGYTAMALDPVSGHYVGLAVLTGGAVIGATVVYARELRRSTGGGDSQATPSRRASAGLVAAATLVVWVLFKEGFVRQDEHRVVFFASLPLVVAALLLGPIAARPVAAARAVALMLVSSFAAFVMVGTVPPRLIDPIANAREFAKNVGDTTVPARRREVVDEARASLRAKYALPPSMIARIGKAGVDIGPWEQTVAWAHPELRWQPLPTLQRYFAYTAALDDRDAEVVSSDRAPQFLLRQAPASIDSRWPGFDGPATQIAVACHYRQVEVSPTWQLLERSGNRCGRPRELSRTAVSFGEPVDVPDAGQNEMIAARIDLHLPWWWRVADTVYKTPLLDIRLNDAPGNRFVVGTEGQLHLLVPADPPGPSDQFALQPIRRIELGPGSRGYSATITFFAIPVTGP